MTRTKMAVAVFLLVLFGALFADLTFTRGKSLSGSSMTVWVFDVGQGDAIFIDGPKMQVLIDGGPDAAVLEKLSQVMLPWDMTIDAVVVAHPHADHLMGIVPVLERYRVGDVFESGQGYGTPEFFAFEKEAPEMRTMKAGDVIELGDGATLMALAPQEPYAGKVISDPNDGSVVFLLSYGEMNMLLTGDAGVDEEAEWKLEHVDVLKVGHHGSRTSTSDALLQMTTPNAAIISVGEENDYGLPDEDVLERLSAFGTVTYRTDVHKDVRVWTDGGEPIVRLFDL